MKVRMADDYKKFFTLEDVARAKMVIKYEKENDEETVKGWAEYAAREAVKDLHDYYVEILKAEAKTAKNRRIWDAYGTGTGDMDVWIDATAKTVDGFIEVGAYLSDIWQTGAVEYTHHMYVKYYKAV